MRAWVVAIVVIGIAAAAAAGAATGFDAATAAILALIVATGMLAVAVAARSRTGTIRPARCDVCGGLISSNAPRCKHCGVPRDRGPQGGFQPD